MTTVAMTFAVLSLRWRYINNNNNNNNNNNITMSMIETMSQPTCISGLLVEEPVTSYHFLSKNQGSCEHGR